MNIHQALLIDNPLLPAFPKDFSRPLVVHISKSSSGNISHVTTEFSGVRAKFFCCIVFDGSGDFGVGLGSFAMPKTKLTQAQKAVMLLSIIEHLISIGALPKNFEFYKDRIASEFSGGVGNILDRYKAISENSMRYIDAIENNRSITPSLTAAAN